MSDETSTNDAPKSASKKGSASKKSSASKKGSASGHQRPYDPEGLIGRTLAGRYAVEKCIGKGGMGVVYLARQQALERMVVIKVLSRSVDDDEASGRFEREAVGMSRLHHPNIVSIYDFGHADDQAYICMEYVDGETLSRRIKRDGAMEVDVFCHIAAQLLKGIGEAHALGLIHRDIKPSNIMLTERHGQHDYVKILDFGLAKLVHNARQVTKEQSLVGSTAFLSPEQIMGNDIDQRVDVYALGVLFYYMLTGQKPFTADDDITVLYQHVHHAPPPMTSMLPEDHHVPRELVELIERMLAKEPDARPPDAGRVHDELAAIMVSISSVDMTWDDGDASAPVASDEASPLAATAPEAREHSGLSSGSQLSGQSFVTDRQMLAMQQANNRRTILIVVALVLLFAAGIGAFWMFRDSHASVESVRAEIVRVEELVDQGKLGRAQSVLDLAKSDLKHHPSLKERFAASEDKLAIAKLLADARFHEEQGRIEGAINDYTEILRRDPDQQAARAALARLVAERLQKKAAVDEEAVDDEPTNEKPVNEEQAAEESVAQDSRPEQHPEGDEPVEKPAMARQKKKQTKARSPDSDAAGADDAGAKKAGTDKPSETEETEALLLPIGEQEASDEPTNDDVQLLPMD